MPMYVLSPSHYVTACAAQLPHSLRPFKNDATGTKLLRSLRCTSLRNLRLSFSILCVHHAEREVPYCGVCLVDSKQAAEVVHSAVAHIPS